MKNRGAGSKAHLSDGEEEQEIEVVQEEQISKEELERRQLENLPVIADSEVSPAAYLFQNQVEQDDINLFEQQ
jgi:hypothetical protein